MTRHLQYKIQFSTRWCWLLLLLAGMTTGCKKLVDVQLPISSIAGSSVFQNDATAAAALNAVYASLYSQGNFDGNGGLGAVTGLYSDELKNWNSTPSFLALYGNGVSSTLGGVTGYWSNFYGQLYSANLAIEGLKKPNSALSYQNQWLGEAYFMRGLLYFHLTNCYGDVPLVLGTDYLANNQLARSPQANVYKQIVADLKQAQSLLDSKYHNAAGATTTDRGRPNAAAATALLARVYLYTQDWTNAEAQASNIIADATDYQLTTLPKTFLLNSSEIIWGIEPYNGGLYPYVVKDVKNFYMPAGKTPAAIPVLATLSDSLLAAFEPGDARKANWVGKDSVSPTAVYYYAYKYKAMGTYTAPQEMIALFRLAEQYLIRAEARAQQNNGTGATADLNAVRARAGLAATTATTQSDLLAAILRERRVEFFTEGHRFYDLRRTGNLDALMTVLAPLKGGAWASFKAWWPISVGDIQSDVHLTQTPGFQ